MKHFTVRVFGNALMAACLLRIIKVRGHTALLERLRSMASAAAAKTFRFHFGQRVRVIGPHPESGATGQVINGSLYVDGRELYAVDVPGGAWIYESGVLEDASTPGRKRREG